MNRKIIAIVTAVAFALLGLTACSSEAPKSTWRPVATITPYTASPEATVATTSSEDQVKVNQVEKIKYMQDPERLVLFANSGYDVAKVKLTKDIMSGKFGTPTTSVEGSIFEAEVGDPLDPSKFYAWFIADDNGKGAPDFSTVWSVGVHTPGYDYVAITDMVNHRPTEIGGKSVDLKYDVTVGPSYLGYRWTTCLWPDLKVEKDVCYGENSDAETKSVSDLMAAELEALRALNDNMTAIYGDHWREG